MRGWKTWIGGLIMVGLGAYLIAAGEIDKGVASIGAGVTALGIGHKIEKSGRTP